MSIVYEGSCVLEVDGVEIEITKLDVKTATGRKLVKTVAATPIRCLWVNGFQLDFKGDRVN